MIADRIGDLYAGLAWEYDNHGNKIRETFLGLDGNPIGLEDGVSSYYYEYNDEDVAIKRTTYDVNGEVLRVETHRE